MIKKIINIIVVVPALFIIRFILALATIVVLTIMFLVTACAIGYDIIKTVARSSWYAIKILWSGHPPR